MTAGSERKSNDLVPLVLIRQRFYEQIRDEQSHSWHEFHARARHYDENSTADTEERLRRRAEIDAGNRAAGDLYRALGVLSRGLDRLFRSPDVDVKCLQALTYYTGYDCRSEHLTSAQWLYATRAVADIWDAEKVRLRQEEAASYSPAQVLEVAENFLSSVLENFDDIFPAASFCNDPSELQDIKNRHYAAMERAVSFVRQCIADMRREYADQELAAAFQVVAASASPSKASGTRPANQVRRASRV